MRLVRISRSGRTIVPNGFHRATLFGLFSELLFLRSLRLVKHDAIAIVFITSEYRGRCLAAQVAINAVGIHIPRAWRILRQAAVFVGHITSRFLFGLKPPPLAEA